VLSPERPAETGIKRCVRPGYSLNVTRGRLRRGNRLASVIGAAESGEIANLFDDVLVERQTADRPTAC
jgi:hypothetical protein